MTQKSSAAEVFAIDTVLLYQQACGLCPGVEEAKLAARGGVEYAHYDARNVHLVCPCGTHEKEGFCLCNQEGRLVSQDEVTPDSDEYHACSNCGRIIASGSLAVVGHVPPLRCRKKLAKGVIRRA